MERNLACPEGVSTPREAVWAVLEPGFDQVGVRFEGRQRPRHSGAGTGHGNERLPRIKSWFYNYLTHYETSQGMPSSVFNLYCGEPTCKHKLAL